MVVAIPHELAEVLRAHESAHGRSGLDHLDVVPLAREAPREREAQHSRADDREPHDVTAEMRRSVEAPRARMRDA